jgi:hypothetical protein
MPSDRADGNLQETIQQALPPLRTVVEDEIERQGR